MSTIITQGNLLTGWNAENQNIFDKALIIGLEIGDAGHTLPDPSEIKHNLVGPYYTDNAKFFISPLGRFMYEYENEDLNNTDIPVLSETINCIVVTPDGGLYVNKVEFDQMTKGYVQTNGPMKPVVHLEFVNYVENIGAPDMPKGMTNEPILHIDDVLDDNNELIVDSRPQSKQFDVATIIEDESAIIRLDYNNPHDLY